MNILPKKSWHVRTHKNIEKVRRDEAKAAEDAKRIQARVLLAEQEARTDFLRKRAKQLGEGSSTQYEEEPQNLPLDLFSGVEQGKGDHRTNVEHEAEAKAKAEKWEKQVGILQYLGQNIEKPWYLDAHDVRMKIEDEKDASDNPLDKSAFKANPYDPLNNMQIYLEQMKEKRLEATKGKADTSHSAATKSIDRRKKDEQHRSERSRRNHRSRDRSKSRGSDHKRSRSDHQEPLLIPKVEGESAEQRESRLKLVKLREERLKREEIEKERTRQLLKNSGRAHSSSWTPVSTPVQTDDRKRNYHSQFNPRIAKQGHWN